MHIPVPILRDYCEGKGPNVTTVVQAEISRRELPTQKTRSRGGPSFLKYLTKKVKDLEKAKEAYDITKLPEAKIAYEALDAYIRDLPSHPEAIESTLPDLPKPPVRIYTNLRTAFQSANNKPQSAT